MNAREASNCAMVYFVASRDETGFWTARGCSSIDALRTAVREPESRVFAVPTDWPAAEGERLVCGKKLWNLGERGRITELRAVTLDARARLRAQRVTA